MRGSIVKRIRRHVDSKYPFMSDNPMYRQNALGQITLAPQCKRALVQFIKRAYKRGDTYSEQSE